MDGSAHFDVPWLPLADGPSLMRRLAVPEGSFGSPSIFVKEEASLSQGVGGTKIRGLEFLLGSAVASGADTVVTSAVAGSNYLAALAYHSRRVDLKCVAAVRPAGGTFWSRRNALLAHQQGCRVVSAAPDVSLRSSGCLVTRLAESLEHKGSRTARLPFGGGSAVAALGQIIAAREAADQLAREVSPDALDVVVAVGTGWLAAGLVVGFGLVGLPIPVRIVAVPAVHERRLPPHVVVNHTDELRRYVAQFGHSRSERASVTLSWASAQSKGELRSEDGRQWAGVETDPTYTAEAFATFADAVRVAPSGRAVVFWHTADLRPRIALDAQVRAGQLPAAVANVLLG